MTYDGDSASVKGVYYDEANDELEEWMNSKENLVTFGCTPLKYEGDDVSQSFYALTRILDKTPHPLTQNIAFG